MTISFDVANGWKHTFAHGSICPCTPFVFLGINMFSTGKSMLFQVALFGIAFQLVFQGTYTDAEQELLHGLVEESVGEALIKQEQAGHDHEEGK